MTEVADNIKIEPPQGYGIGGSLLAQAQSTGLKTYEGKLYGGTVTAIPVGAPGSNGQTLWQITVHTGDGRTATVNVRLTGQFGPEQLVDGSYVKNQIGAQILADRARHIPASVSEASFLNLGMDRASARIAAEFYRSMREQGHSVARSWSFVWRTYIDGYASRGPAGGHKALTTTVTNPPPSKPNIPPADPNAGDGRIVGPTAASTRYGEPFDVRPFGDRAIIYQVINEKGNYELRLSLRDPEQYRKSDFLVFENAGRPIDMSQDYSHRLANGIGPIPNPLRTVGSPIYTALNDTLKQALSPANRANRTAPAGTPMSDSPVVRFYRGALGAVRGVTVDLLEALGRVFPYLPDLATIMPITPRALEGQAQNQRNANQTSNQTGDLIRDLNDLIGFAIGVPPDSPEVTFGRFAIGVAEGFEGFLHLVRGSLQLVRLGEEVRLVVKNDSILRRFGNPSPDDLGRIVSYVNGISPNEYAALPVNVKVAMREGLLNNSHVPSVQPVLARLDTLDGLSPVAINPRAAAAPPVPAPVPAPVSSQVKHFLGKLDNTEAAALRPFVIELVAGKSPEEALQILSNLGNNRAALQALRLKAALQQANIAVASMKVNGKVPDLYPPGQEKAATAAAFKDNRVGDAARAANQPGVVSLAFKIRTDAGVEVPAVFTGSPAEVLALLRSSAFTQGRAYVPAHFPEEAGRTIEAIKKLTGWRPTATATATTTGGNTSPVTGTKTSPPALNSDREQVPRLNPRTDEISIATRNLHDIKTLPQGTRYELADFLVRSNPESYADRTAALNALDKAGQIYVLRDAQGGILGTATLTRTADFEWYLGQVAAAPRSGAGGDVMKWLLGDFKQLAKNSNHPVRIWAYTNKAENVYNVRDPSQPGFYAQLGAIISDPNPAGAVDMTTRRRIGIEWRFDANGNPVQPEPTPPQTPPVVPHDMNTPQANVLPTVSPDSPFTFPTKPNSELTFTVGAQPFEPYDPSLAATTLDKAVIGTAAVWNSRPIEGTLELLGRKLSTLTRPVTEWVVDIPTHIWNALPEPARTQIVHHNELVRRAPLDLPLGIGSAIEWVFVGPDGKESLITKFATFVDRLWQTPAVVIPMNTAKVIGFLAHKGTTALLVIEATAGGPKLHLYNPTTNQPITEPSLEALTIGYVPKTDGTIAVTLQLSLVPEASFTFFLSDEVARPGISRFDRKVTGNHQSVARIISTWQANPVSFGAMVEAGTPNLHWASGITVRPVGEIGANPLVVQTSTNPNGGSLDVYTLSALNPSGFIGKYDTLRLGPIAITPDRGVFGLGSGYKAIVGSSGLGFNQTGYLPKVTASAFQTNPAFNFEMREQAPVAAGVSVDGEHLQAVWSVDDGEIPKVGLFMRTQGAFQIENKLFVDPATGWMALQSPHDDGPLLWVHYDIANRAKVTGQGRGGTFDEAEFGVNWSVATSDQWLQALQTEPGLTRVRNAILELGGGDVDKGLRQLSDKVADPDVRRLIIDNTAYFKALTQNRN